MKKKKSNIGYIIIIILLILGFGGYILFDQGIINFSKENSDKVDELDVNSRLVQRLYDLVTVDFGYEPIKYWIYKDNNVGLLKDFDVNTSSEDIKMNIVAINLVTEKRKVADCNSINIPNSKSVTMPNLESINMPSVCYRVNELEDGNYDAVQYYYEKEYVESLYKEIFGKDAKLDTSVDFSPVNHKNDVYSYVKEYDAYFLYHIDGGAQVEFEGYRTKLVKAEKIGKKLNLYEDVVLEKYGDLLPDKDDPEVIGTEEFKMVYTFELEDDGMYKFVSRVKKDK